MEKKKVCAICKKPFAGYGNNPAPFSGKVCCDDCNDRYVIPLRLFHLVHNPKHALRFKEDGTVEMLKPKDKYFTLEELQTAVGGLIELYPSRFMNMLVVCDEEGLLKERPLNKIFANLSAIKLVGDVLLCPTEIFEEPDEEET